MLSTAPLQLVIDDDETGAPPSAKSGIELRTLPEDAPRRVCETIRFVTDQGEAIVHLVEGRAAWVTSNLGLRTFYGRLLECSGLTARDLELVFARCRAERLNFCEMLVTLELVDRPLLRALFREHVARHLRMILAAPGLRATVERSRVKFSSELLVPLADILDKKELARWNEVVTRGHLDGDRKAARRFVEDPPATLETPRGVVSMILENFSRDGAVLRGPVQLARATRVVVRLDVGNGEVALPGSVVRFRRDSSLAGSSIDVAWIDVTPEIERAIEETFAAL